jgi:hypothetical protein
MSALEVRKLGFAVGGVVLTVLLSACGTAPKKLTEMTVADAELASPSGSYLVIHFGENGAEMGPNPCSVLGAAGGSAWEACPSTSQKLHFARTGKRVYLSMEGLMPVYKTTAHCVNVLGVGPEATDCDSALHTRVAPTTAEVLGSAFTAFVLVANTREMDDDKIRKFVDETWPEARRVEVLNQDLAYRSQRGARVAETQAKQAVANQAEQARIDAGKRQREAVVEQSKRNFDMAQRQSLRIGIPICTADNQFGYVEQIADDRVMVSTRKVFYRDPTRRRTGWMDHNPSGEAPRTETYLLFAENPIGVSFGPEVDRRWVNRSAWAACPIDIK